MIEPQSICSRDIHCWRFEGRIIGGVVRTACGAVVSYRREARILLGNEEIHVHKRANQPIIISLGLTTLNSRSMIKILTA